jgi:serine/threonine protein kinase
MLHNRYRLLEKVGQGGMGAVYVAQDTQLGDRLVAVKEMSMSRLASQEVPPAIEQFKREAHLLASLHHMNLPVIYDHFGEEGRWYLVMSFVQGGTLQTYLDTAPSKRLPVNEVIRIGIDLCNVLDYLHTHQPQIIFRDLKPLNIMITPQGQIYLIDFGIARHFKQDQSKDTAYYYSAGYAPPEQYGQSQTGPRSDIYSLGATMHQMLTGHNPASKPFHFPALQLLDPTIPLPLANLIAQMLEMSEPQRPPGMAAVRAELEKVRNPAPIPPIGHVDYAAKKPLQSQQSTLPDEASPQPSDPQDQKSPARPRQNRLSVAGSKQFSFWWIGFSVATLAVGIWSAGSWSILNLDPLSSLSGNFSIPYISLLLAALVGLVFFFSRGQRIVDMVGGIILAILGDSILLLTHKDLSSSYSYPDSGTASVGLAELIISFGSVFLLGLGMYCFTRHAGKRQKIVFGIGLAVLGVCQIVVWNRWPNWYYPWDNILYRIPSIALWLWIGQVVLGIVILIRALFNYPILP